MRRVNLSTLLLAVVPTLSGAVETINVIVCLVQWADHANRALIPKNEIAQLWNGPSNTEIVPGESISAWLESNSYGKYNIQADVVDYYKMTQTEAEARALGRGIRDILLPVLENAAANGYDMSKYSGDTNRLSGVVFAHSGYDANQLGKDCETGAEMGSRVISKSIGAGDDFKIGNTGYKLWTMTTMSIYRSFCNLEINRIGVPTHEWIHAKYALDDLYDTSGTRYENNWALGGIGAFGIM